jgi:hypothetical protein
MTSKLRQRASNTTNELEKAEREYIQLTSDDTQKKRSQILII